LIGEYSTGGMMLGNQIQATAVILAGGNSRRMGREKAFLLVKGKPLIEHIFSQLYKYFNQVLISADNKDLYSFLGVPVIPDKKPGSGPLMGIASALEASKNDINFVTACDIPDINIPFVTMMITMSKDYDGVVPVNSKSQYEPMFAVYKKSMLKGIKKVLSGRKKKISDVFPLYRIKFITLSNTSWLRNLNTMEDYKSYIKNNEHL
jgi:molybdenum cofactor guanylyltransferase